jgi:hypothetical protein
LLADVTEVVAGGGSEPLLLVLYAVRREAALDNVLSQAGFRRVAALDNGLIDPDVSLARERRVGAFGGPQARLRASASIRRMGA